MTTTMFAVPTPSILERLIHSQAGESAHADAEQDIIQRRRQAIADLAAADATYDAAAKLLRNKQNEANFAWTETRKKLTGIEDKQRRLQAESVGATHTHDQACRAAHQILQETQPRALADFAAELEAIVQAALNSPRRDTYCSPRVQQVRAVLEMTKAAALEDYTTPASVEKKISKLRESLPADADV